MGGDLQLVIHVIENYQVQLPNISSELDHDADGDGRALFMQNANSTSLLFLSDEQRSSFTPRTAI